MIWKVFGQSKKCLDHLENEAGLHIWTMLMHKILQTHLLWAFLANLKIDAIYALYPESFCDPNLAIRKVFAFSDSDRKYTIFMYNLWQPVLIYMSACCIISVRYRCTFPMYYFPIVFACGFIFLPSGALYHLNFQRESLLLLYNWGKAQFIFRSDISHNRASKLNTHFSWISQDEKSSFGYYKMKMFSYFSANF